MTAIWRTQALLQTVARDELARPRFAYLDPECQRWEFDGRQSSVTAIKTVVNNCVTEAERVFAEDLLLGYLLESFNLPSLASIVDNLNRTETGYSFLTDDVNMLYRFENALICRVMNDEDEERAHTFHSGVSDGKLLYKAAACRRFLEAGQSFLALYATACHMSHGQPSRGMELFTATWRTVGNSQVSFRISDGEVYLCIYFHKPDTMKGHQFLVPYFQCARLSLLGVAYMVLVRPLEIRFARLTCPAAASVYNTHIFVGPSGRWQTRHLTMAIEKHTEPVLGFKLDTRSMRQVLIFILHKHAGASFLQPDREYEEEDDPQELMALQTFNAVGDFMAAHAVGTARGEYGIEMRTVGAMPEEKLRQIRFVSMGERKLTVY